MMTNNYERIRNMSKPVFKHAAAWLLALMVALVVAPGMALANDLVAAGDETQPDLALTVYTQYADEAPVVAKSFTQADLEEIAAQNTESLAYVYSGFVSVADKYVTLDQLLKKVGKKGLTVTDEDSVEIAASDLKVTFTNEQLKAETKFFAGVYHDGDKLVFSDLGDAKDAPAILALSEGKAKWAANANTTAGALLENITTSSDSALQWLCGVTKESVTGDSAELPSGKKAPSHVVSITVKTPASSSFTVYSQDGADAKPVQAKEYTRESLEPLATKGAKGFLYWGSDVWMVGATTSSIDIVKLIEDAGLKLEADDAVVLTAPDGFKTTLSAADIQSEKYFYANATETGTDASSPDEVGTVLALNWVAAPVSGTAGATVTALIDSGLTSQYRLFTGVSEENYLAKNAAGKRFATNPKSLTLIKGDLDISAAKVELDKAQATYTGKAQKGVVKSVKLNGEVLPSSAYTVNAVAGTNAGDYKVTVTGAGRYVGMATATFTITKANQVVAAKNKTISLKAKKLKKKAQTVKASKVAKGNSAKSAITYKLTKVNKAKKKFKVAANGKITVKKKLKAGTYKLTITASAAANANYNKASKNFTVTIDVK